MDAEAKRKSTPTAGPSRKRSTVNQNISEKPSSMSASSNEFESSDEEVVLVNPEKDDYIEIPRSKNEKPPPTRDLVPIPREKLHPFKELYEKQPQSVKKLVRQHFYKGKPVIQPPPLSRFVNSIRALKAQRKLQHKSEGKCRRLSPPNSASSNSDKIKRKTEATVNVVDIYETDPKLVHVDYPARVAHVDKAISTMGGVGNITKVFANVNKKLNVSLRPDDPCCNALKGEAQPTIGILLKVRRRKAVQKRNASTSVPANPKLENTEVVDVESEHSTNEDVVVINGVRFTKSQILSEDKKLLKGRTKKTESLIKDYHDTGDPEQYYLRVPKDHKPSVNNNIRVDALGIIHRVYRFDGICDFQYLPLKKTKSGVISGRENLFPLFGKPSENKDTLFVSDSLLNDYSELDTTLIPPMMSRIDRPLDMIIEHIMDSDKIKLAPQLKDKDAGIIATTRARRSVFTIFYSFQVDITKPKNPVPTEPLKGALEDVKKRPAFKDARLKISKCFEEKPIWSKTALECESQVSSISLKYVLPTIAYFATNGPWRALWIRFGYDASDHPLAFLYQTVDFRVPHEYKMFLDETDRTDDTLYIFRPNCFPPRGQMFYQLHHLKCEELERLVDIAREKIAKNELKYDLRFGWLKEGTFEYIRHVLIQYIETYLEESGKIPEHPTQKVFLTQGELEPNEKLIPRPRKGKRFRKVRPYRPKPKSTVHPNPSTKPGIIANKSKSRQTKEKGKGKPKESGKWAYQGILQDLSIKEINKYGSRKEDEKLEILDDDSLLSDEEFEDETTTDESEYDDTNDVDEESLVKVEKT